MPARPMTICLTLITRTNIGDLTTPHLGLVAQMKPDSWAILLVLMLQVPSEKPLTRSIMIDYGTRGRHMNAS